MHWVVLLASLIITLVAWSVSQHYMLASIENKFNQEVDQVIALIQERMGTYEDALWAGVAAIYGRDGHIDADHWRLFAQSLSIEQKYPGINGIGYIDYITSDDLDKYLAEQRQTRPDFRVFPSHGGDEFWPVTAVEPVHMNIQSIGLDMVHEGNRYVGAKQARDTGNAQITAPITLVQDAEKTPGFLFFAPYYSQPDKAVDVESRRAEFVRLVYAPFIVKKFMQGALAKKNRVVRIKISDSGTVLYNEHFLSDHQYDSNPLFSRVVRVPFYGRVWAFDVKSTLGLRPSSFLNEPNLILIGGLIIDVLLFFIVFIFSRSNSLAYRITKELREKAKIMEHAIEGIATIDIHGVYTYVNEAYAQMSGYSPDELLGCAWESIIHADDYEHMLQEYQHMREHGKISREVKGIRKDRTVFYIQMTMISDYDETGAFVGYYCFVKDINARVSREIEVTQSNVFLELIFSSIPDYAFIKDHEFKFVRVNAALLELYPEALRDTIVGTTAIELYDEDQAAQFLQYDKEAFEKGRSETYETIAFPNGEIRTLYTKKVRFYDSAQNVYILGVARDVTERELLLKQLSISNEELDEFAYIASHDLKEPLRGIYNHAAMVMRQVGESLDETSIRRLNRIITLTKYMENLVSDLLFFSRLGRADIAKKTIDLEELVREVVHSIPMIDEEAVDVKILSPLPQVYCDRVRIGEVYRNLITNGIKYNESAVKKIEIGVTQQNIDGKMHQVFFVRDNGIGIDASFHHEIFRIFKRLHKKGAYGGGTGSGLTFVKKILNRHGGEVWLESSKGQGSTFYFTL